LFQVASALQAGAAVEEIIAATHFDPWFVRQPADIAAVRSETLARAPRLEMLTAADMLRLKRFGFSDAHLALLYGEDEMAVRAHRKSLGVTPSYYRVDTCAAEFEAHTPYLYSTYEEDDEAKPTDRKEGDHLGRRDHTGSGRGSSSITAASMPALRSKSWAMRRSW
jgi:carbamoyl-phosphate synthase large subunit